MDDKKAQNFGINPFEDDDSKASAGRFSDDDGPDEDESAKKKQKKQKESRVVDEDLSEDKADVKHKTKKKIKGYKNDVKQYVSETAGKGQRSELKDSLGEEGAFADKDLSVKKKRKRKRKKKTVVPEVAPVSEVAEVAPEVVPEVKEPEVMPQEPEASVPEVAPVAEEPVPAPPVAEPVLQVQNDSFNPFENEQPVVPTPVINPFSESHEGTWEEPKWKEEIKDEEPVDQVVEPEAIEPEIVEDRKVTKEPENVPVEPKIVPKEVPVPSHVEESEDEGFLHMLSQVGITKGKIVGILITLVVIILVIVVAFFIPFGSIFGGGVKTQVEQSSPKQAVPAIQTTQNEVSGVNMSEILGNEYDALVLGDDKIFGVFFALRLGGEFVSSEHRFAYYMRKLNEMQNLYSTDIYKLLDKSYDRRVTLNDFLINMKRAIEEAKQIQNEVAKAAANLNAAEASANSQRDIFETNFFSNIKDLRGQDSFANLEKFVGFSQNAIRLRAYYKAYNYISELYSNSIKKIEPRYQDILVNADALVKGIHVFDVPNSDINAIIRLSQ